MVYWRMFLFGLILMIPSIVLAQKKNGITPMHVFFQKNADSTMVLEFTTNWSRSPAYYLLSKKGDTLSCYSYKEIENRERALVPSKIAEAIWEKNTFNIYKVPVDINVYFNPHKINLNIIRKFWEDVGVFKPWSLKDDSIDGEGCPIVKNGNVTKVYDGGGIKLYLVTKKEIKILDFYAPEFYERHCPGRPGRVSILKIAALFRENLKIKY